MYLDQTTSVTIIRLSYLLVALLNTGGPQLVESALTVPDDVKVFSDPHGTIKFNHLVVDKDRGSVYLGAVNRLYQLSPNLDLLENYTTGPVPDSLDCSVLECAEEVPKKLTNNYNKALVIDYANSRLLACGSVQQGLCVIHNIQNISISPKKILEPVVANNATASTVAFIAPGPVKQPSPSYVLYVGVTYTGNSAYRSEVPAVASRSLENHRMLAIADQGVTTGTRVSVNNLSRERYIINYVYGFPSGSFSYFLTTQLKSSVETSPYISKLIRICHEDKDYYSYTEIPIECTDEKGRTYNLAQAAFVGKPGSELATSLGIRPQDDVLFAVFAESEQPEGDGSNRPSKHSAMCIYSLNAIRRKFMQNINYCFSGKGSRGLDFILSSHDCIPTKIQTINEDFCGLDVNTPLGGEIPVSAVPVIAFNTLLTAVTVTSTGSYTVVFIGTSTGHLKKVVVKNANTALEYADQIIDEGSPVNADLLLDLTMNYLYIMTEKKLTKIKLQDCSKYETCWDCLTAKDPYCGWCSLENKCSLRSNCQDAANDALSWIPYKTGRCTLITSVTPKELQRNTAQTLALTIDNLPPLTGQFLCVFTTMDKILITNATRNNFGVNCTTPSTNLLPSIPPGHHYFTAKLSIKTTTDPEFVHTNFTFFDCNTYTSCTTCVSSVFPCDWCVDGHRCTHNTAQNCRNDILVTGVNREGPSYRSGPTFCSTIKATQDGSSEILVAAGTKKSIRVKIHVVGQFIVQTRFLCQFNIEGRVTSVKADLIGDTIYCEGMEFSYTQQDPNITAHFAVLWGGSKPLDNPNDIHVVIFRCRDMANNCGMCLSLEKKYGCGWCQSTNTCEILAQCDAGSGGWLDQNHTCPNPSIVNFRPHLGPWEGGTNVTIQGINLGRTFTDIYGGISVAGISCVPYKHLYKPTREIVCKVDGPGTTEVRRGPVLVKVENFRGESKQQFTFVDPKIEDIFPKHGPRSGGTELTVKGKYMNAGGLIEVFIDELPCKVFANDSTETKCITSASNKREGKVTVKFDWATRTYDEHFYEYIDDPTIGSLESGLNSLGKVPKGIPAGGIKISVTGKNLLSIQKPLLYVYNENHTKQYFSKCEVHSNSLMTCLSPYIPDVNSSSIDAENPKHLDYGFKMDGVDSVQNITIINKSYPPFALYPNPIFDYFPDSIKHHESDYLTINGQNIDRACHDSDIVVQIGKSICNVTSLSREQLTCRLPMTQPSRYNNGSEFELNSTNPLEVIVSIGDHFHQTIGSLNYSSNRDGSTIIDSTSTYRIPTQPRSVT